MQIPTKCAWPGKKTWPLTDVNLGNPCISRGSSFMHWLRLSCSSSVTCPAWAGAHRWDHRSHRRMAWSALPGVWEVIQVASIPHTSRLQPRPRGVATSQRWPQNAAVAVAVFRFSGILHQKRVGPGMCRKRIWGCNPKVVISHEEMPQFYGKTMLWFPQNHSWLEVLDLLPIVFALLYIVFMFYIVYIFHTFSIFHVVHILYIMCIYI